LSDGETQQRKSCFIIGPIGEDGTAVRRLADWLLHGIFRPVLESDELGYVVKRADDDTAPGSITNAVIMDIIEADLVVADLTGFNPNAFYELGIRHAIHKPTIHVIAERVALPFDNKDQRTIFVDLGDISSVESARTRLKTAALAVNDKLYKVSNPVTHARALNALQDSADPRDQVIADLEQRLDRLEKDRIAPGIVGQSELATMSISDAIKRFNDPSIINKLSRNHKLHSDELRYNDREPFKGLLEKYIDDNKDTLS